MHFSYVLKRLHLFVWWEGYVPLHMHGGQRIICEVSSFFPECVTWKSNLGPCPLSTEIQTYFKILKKMAFSKMLLTNGRYLC